VTDTKKNAKTGRRAAGTKTHDSLPDAVRLNVVIGTLDVTIPTKWLSDEHGKPAVKVKMIGKVEKEIDKVWDETVRQWEEMKKKRRR